MKFSKEAFQMVVNNADVNGIDTFILDDNKNKVDYHIYMIFIESGNVASIICEKLPASGDKNNYEVFEFNGNKLLEHNIVRIKPLDKSNPRHDKLIEQFVNRNVK